MTKGQGKHNFVSWFLNWGAIVLLLGCALLYFIEKPDESYSYKTHEINGGFGYQVYQNNRLLIQQDFIPTLEGYQAFREQKQAELAAMKVIKRLKNNQRPSLTKNDITEIIENTLNKE